MLTPTQFQQWCRDLHLPAETVDLIARIRFSPPVRRVQGRAGNVSGLYSSKKMGVTIQFESQSVELGALYLMDHDESVLELYDQPHTFKLRYLDKSGKRMQGHYFLADYFMTPPRLPETVVALIVERVQTSPGIPIAALVGDSAGLRANDVYAPSALCQNVLTTRTRCSLFTLFTIQPGTGLDHVIKWNHNVSTCL